jgi:hypothetical protein
MIVASHKLVAYAANLVQSKVMEEQSCIRCVGFLGDLPGVIAVDADAEREIATYELQSEAALSQVKATLQKTGHPPEG